MDLMDLVKGAVSDKVMEQIGGLLGTDEKKTSSVFETGVGSILGGLIKKSESTEGAQEVFEAAQNQDDGILDKLGDILGGGDEQKAEVENQGAGILDGVFGTDSSGGMLGSIAKALGLDEKMAGMLVKFLAPIVMSVIGRQLKSKAMDAAGLGSFLGEQKKSLEFLPASLTNDLGFGDMLSSVNQTAATATATVSNAVSGAGNAAKEVVDSAGKPDGGVRILLIGLLVAVALLACAGFYFLPMISGGADKVPDNAKNVKPVDPIEADKPQGVVLAEKFREIRTGFNGLEKTGKEGAQELVGLMQELGKSIEAMNLGDIEDEVAKKSAHGQLKTFLGSTSRLLDRQEDETKEILTPAFDKLKEQLQAIID